MNFSELAKTSEDSRLVSVGLSGGFVSLLVFHDGLQREVEIQIASSLIFVRMSTGSVSTCFFQLKRLSDLLAVKNGVYVPNQDFPGMMDETRSRLNLAYGLRASEYGFFFSIIGSSEVDLVVREEEDIRFSYPD